jgi:type IV pilus assembly protein PilA
MLHLALRRLRESKTAELEGEGSAEAGFTLIELMVVLLIIAILLAIAIPTFLGVTSSANDRAAQSNLTNALTEATAQYQSSGQSYSGISALLSSSAPEYLWASGSGTNTSTASYPTDTCTTTIPNCVNVDQTDSATSGDNQGVVLAAMSKTGTCWYVAQLQSNPAVVATTGFIQASTAAGSQLLSGSLITKAGTYYAKKQSAGNNCNALYIETPTGGFNWGSSFASAGSN